MKNQLEAPTHIQQAHWDEWVIGSAIDPDLTALNLRSLSGTTPYEYLLYSDKLPRRNDGRLTEGTLKRYRHLEAGGWWCSGDDPLTAEDSLWGCFKPDAPRLNAEGKFIKYEHPPKSETGIFALRVPTHLQEKISYRCGVSLSNEPFWSQVLANADIPLVITEGSKKGGSILTAGYCALSLPGIYNGYRQPKDEQGNHIGSRSPIPQLAAFATPGRKVYFAFDSDSKPTTIGHVNNAIKTTARLLEELGCQCYIASWTKQYKGVDDLIVAKGEAAFENAIASALPLALWQVFQLKQLTYPVSQEIDPKLRYLPDLDIPSSAKFIALKARKGRGKTRQLARIVETAISVGRPALILCHRRQLVEELCHRCGINTITEWRSSETGILLGYGICVDSLRRDCQAAFDPSQWEDAVVIIDEVEQVLWHLLDADTEVKKHRVEILRNLRQLLRNVAQSQEGRIVISDADLSDISLDYIRSLLEFPLEPHIIYQAAEPDTIDPSEQWDVTNYPDTNPSRLVADLIEHICQGGKPFICVSAQKHKSTYGTRNLEATFRKLFPKQKILRIDSESISNPKHPAYGCIAHLNEVLPQYDVVLASPSIETGVSIDLMGHFTSVWAIAGGVSADNAVCQSLARVRENVPRYLWMAKSSFCRIGNGSTSINDLLFSQHRQTDANLKLLLKSEDWEIDVIDTNFQPPSLLCWAKLAVRVNLGMLTYRTGILEALREEGHRIRDVGEDFEDDRLEWVNSQLQETKAANYQAYCQVISEQQKLEPSEYEELSRKQNLTEEERAQLKKTSLCQRYATDEITPDRVAEDESGMYPGLRLHYYLTLGRAYLQKRDLTVLENHLKRGHGALWLPDFNESQWSLKIGLLDFLKIPALLTKEQVHKDDPDLIELEQTAKTFSREIKQILGITIKAENSTVVVYRKLLRQLGVRKLEKLGRFGERGNQHYVYAHPDFSERSQIFARWLAAEETPEPLSPLSWAMQLLNRLELPSRAFTSVEASVAFVQKVEVKLLPILSQVEEFCSDFSQRFWQAVCSLISAFGC